MAVQFVSLSPREAYACISDGLTKRFFSASEVTSHVTRLPDGSESVVGIFERYSWRNSNRMTMTVLCTPDRRGGSEIFFAAAGAGGGFFDSFDWGASASFEKALLRSVEDYVVRDPEA